MARSSRAQCVGQREAADVGDAANAHWSLVRCNANRCNANRCNANRCNANRCNANRCDADRGNAER